VSGAANLPPPTASDFLGAIGSKPKKGNGSTYPVHPDPTGDVAKLVPIIKREAYLSSLAIMRNMKNTDSQNQKADNGQNVIDMLAEFAKLEIDKTGCVLGIRCGQNHSGNDRLAQDGAYCQCVGCGYIYTTAEIFAAVGRGGQKGTKKAYDIRVKYQPA